MNYTEADFDEMRRCAKRELDKRMSFYPKWIAAGKMTQAKADFEIAGMKKIYEYFDNLQRNIEPEQTSKLYLTDELSTNPSAAAVQKSLFNANDFAKNKSMYEWGM